MKQSSRKKDKTSNTKKAKSQGFTNFFKRTLKFIDKFDAWVKSHDYFGLSFPFFTINKKESTATFIGGILSLAIKFIVTLFLLGKFNEMIFFSAP